MPRTKHISDLPVRVVVAGSLDAARAQLLERVPEPWRGGAAADLSEAVAAVREAGAQAVLVVQDQDIESFELLRRARSELPDVPIVAVTPGEDIAIAQRAMSAGATSTIPEALLASDFIGVLRAARRRHAPSSRVPHSETAKGSLSEREQQVLRLIARGYTNKEAAIRLGISVKSVETYRSRALEKLGLKTRADVVRYAIDTGLLHRDGSDEDK